MKLWTRDGALINTLTEHAGRVYEVIFSPDGALLVTSSGDGTIKTWDRNGKLMNTLRGHTTWCTTLASALMVRLW